MTLRSVWDVTANPRMSLDETPQTTSQPRKVIKPDLSLIQAYSFDVRNNVYMMLPQLLYCEISSLILHLL